MSRTNADFKAILLKPSASKQAAESEEAKAAREARQKKKEERKQFYLAKQRKQQQRRGDGGDDDADDEASKYRDRAAERRKMETENVEDEEEIDTDKFSIAESKFLGGDVEHTHLVKGLDFALLQKTRRELESTQNDSTTTTQNENVVELTTKSNLPQLEILKPKKTKKKQDLTPKTEIGLKVHKYLFSKPPLRNEMFAPGRLAYQFDIHNKRPPLPTSVLRSKEESAQMQDAVILSKIDSMIIRRVSNISLQLRDPTIREAKLSAIALAEKRRRAEEQVKAANASTNDNNVEEMLMDDDDDIFADAGGYKLELSEDGAEREADDDQGESLFDREVRLTREAEIAKRKAELANIRAPKTDTKSLIEDLMNDDDEEEAMAATDVGVAMPPSSDVAVAAYPNTDDAYPDTDDAYPNTDDAYPNTDDAYPNTDDAYPNTDDAYPNTDDAYPNTDDAYPDTDAAYDTQNDEEINKSVTNKVKFFADDNDDEDENDKKAQRATSAAVSGLVARIKKQSSGAASRQSDEVAADRIESDMRALLEERGLSMVDEYDTIGITSGGIFDLPNNEEDDDDADEAEAVAARKKKNAKLGVTVDEKQRQLQRKMAKEKNEYEKLKGMVEEKAEKQGLKGVDKAFAEEQAAKSKKAKRKAGAGAKKPSSTTDNSNKRQKIDTPKQLASNPIRR